MGELLDADRLRRKLRVICKIRSVELAALGVKAPPLDPDELAARYAALGQRIQPHVTDTVYLLHDCHRDGRTILFEGANACLLDIDHGDVPLRHQLELLGARRAGGHGHARRSHRPRSWAS